jgi:hypothetical protein
MVNTRRSAAAHDTPPEQEAVHHAAGPSRPPPNLGVPPNDPGERIAFLEENLQQMARHMENLAKQNEELRQQIPARRVIPEGASRHEDGGERGENGEEVLNNGHIPYPPPHDPVQPQVPNQPPYLGHLSQVHDLSHHGQESHIHAQLEDLKRKYERMSQAIDQKENGQGSVVEDLLRSTNLPFTDRITAFPLPDKFKIPRIDKFTGEEDPAEHIEAFREHSILHATPDEISCRAFPLTLKSSAREWFGKLPPKSIDSFDALGRQFLTQFLAGRRRRKSAAHLLTVKQKSGESLREYLMRFNKEKMSVEDPKEDVVLFALLNGIRPDGGLMAELARKTPTRLQTFMDKAEEFMNGEETIKALMESRSERPTPAKEKKDPRGDRAPARIISKPTPARVGIRPEPSEQAPKAQKRDWNPIPERTWNPIPITEREFKWTPLNTSVSEILMQIQDDPTLRWPQKMRADPDRRSRAKYCDFHADHGHDTEECIILRLEIEKLIKMESLRSLWPNRGSRRTIILHQIIIKGGETRGITTRGIIEATGTRGIITRGKHPEPTRP